MINRTIEDTSPVRFNTAFRYELADKTGKKVARAGLSRSRHLPALHARIRAGDRKRRVPEPSG